MTTQHTPGPWIFGVRNYDDECKLGFIEKPFDYKGPGFFDNPAIFGADNTEVVGCDEYLIFSSPENARLIAAAPELLEALKVARHMIVEDGTPIGWSVSRLDEVIAKATGES
jgi:hypothetical protein